MEHDVAMPDEAPDSSPTIEARLTEIAGLDLSEEAVREAVRASRGSEADRLGQVAERLFSLGKYAETERIYRHLLRGQPDDPFLLNSHAACLASCYRYDEALEAARRALALKPDFVDAYSNIGQMLQSIGRPDTAIGCFAAALRINSKHAETLCNMAVALSDLGLIEDSRSYFRRALAIRPDHVPTRMGYGMNLLRAEQFAQGWEEFEARYAQLKPNFNQPVPPRRIGWLAEIKPGERIFLYHGGGLGDTLQMVRYAPRLAATGAEISVSVQAPLVELLRQNLPGVEVYGPRACPLEFEGYLPLLSLPRLLGLDARSLPYRPPEMRAPPANLRRFDNLRTKGARPRIGVAWSGSPAHRNDKSRSIAFAEFQSFMSDNVEWHFVQNEIRKSDREAVTQFGRLNTHFDLTDFCDTAALVSCLDLIVTVDTSVAHLAAAMGRPTWILLSFAADWRWGMLREDSLWYPSVRLFRQPFLGAWRPVFERLRAAIDRRFG
jgi:Flp pilus assembly protein TadD